MYVLFKPYELLKIDEKLFNKYIYKIKKLRKHMINDLYPIIKDALSLIQSYNIKKIKKIPLKKFIKLLEIKIGLKLNKQSSAKIIQELEHRGDILSITTIKGKKYIVTGNLI